MHQTIWFQEHLASPLGDVLNAAAGAVEEVDYKVAPSAGIRTAEVTAAIRGPLAGLGFTLPEGGVQLATASSRQGADGTVVADGYDAHFGVSVHVHGGRARTNNEALYSVLRAAAAADVLACALVVPATYKGGQCALPIVRQLEELSSWAGISLSLQAACVIAY